MLSSIKSILDPAISVTPLTSAAMSDVFEAYVLTLIIRAAKEEGAGIRYVDRNGRPATSLVLRTSPGFIYSSAKNYTHVVIEFPSRPTLEAHTGVKVAGKSGVLHELDVAVLESAEGENCRRNNVSPRSTKVRIGVECKFYFSTLQLHLARGFVGLVTDLSVTNPFFVTNTSSTSVERLLSHRVSQGWEKDITPTSRHNEVGRLVSAFRSCFKNFKAR